MQNNQFKLSTSATTKKVRKNSVTQPKTKSTQELMAEDLERWRGESPATGSFKAMKENVENSEAKTQYIKTSSTKKLHSKRNSANQISPDVTTQGWSAKDIAQQSVYEDEATVKAEMKSGTKQKNSKEEK